MGQRGHSIKPEVRRPNRRLWAVLGVQCLAPESCSSPNRCRRRVLLYRGGQVEKNSIKVLFFDIGLGWDNFLGGEALYSDDCSEAPVGSPNLWFDAMTALAHPTNYSGAFAAYIAPQRPVRKKFCFFFRIHMNIRREFVSPLNRER